MTTTTTTTTTTTDPVARSLWALQAYDTAALATSGAAGPHVAGVYVSPRRHGDGLQLVTAMLRGSRKLQELASDPRVALLWSPGQPSRWIQASGRATVVHDEARHEGLYAQLLEHAPGAQPFVRSLPVVPVVIDLEHVKIVEDTSRPAIEFDLPAASREG